MSEPYQSGPYDPYDPHRQAGAAGPWQGYDQQAPPGHDPQLTQQWQGQTWETQSHPQTPAAPETAYLPPRDNPYQAQQQHFADPYAQPQAQPYAQPHAPQPRTAQPYAQPQPQPEPATAPGHGPGAGPGPEAAPDYGPATLVGNARITDAQRARLEGRSPVIEPGMQPALLTAVLGLLLAVTAPAAPYALVVPLVLLQAVTAAGWFRLNGMWPARQGIALAFAGALTADVAVLAAGRDHAPAAILGPLGAWVLLSLVLQLRSHASPDERMYGLMATVASTALSVLATGYLGAGPHAVSVGAAAVAVAVLARALPLPTPVSVVVSLLAAAGAGIAVGGMTGLGAKGALLGGAAAACALIGHRVASYDYPSRFVHFTAGVALPLSAAAPVVWVLGRALG
ncbi:hypothetical protein AQJ66_07650 [Streptomyces bungoensis]|uniref:Peptidase C83 domain-containing protein n=1 Tax=Streptomyces bungoensis TaxID=285568 RepID=A0A101T9C7_9ACTN|nr:hypothetical protein [Streptomyces bungoensis]KUN88222.1 hypothetical protein AQJ66_07650 [Streptomyces bungoensis]